MIRIGLSDQLGQTKRFFPSVIGVLALLVIALVAVFNLFDHNDVGYATVVQFPNGSIRVVTEPGIFFQGFGKMTVYKTANDTLAFSKDPKEGGDGAQGDTSIPVRFRDGGQGKVTIDVTFKLPEDKESLGRIHTD